LIDKLTFLVALDREKHFGRAAVSCGVTQPTLSAGLKQLETTLGVLLVHRSGRFGGFTPEGERVLAWARRIVSDTHAMQDEVRARRQGLSGLLRLASVPTALPAIARLTTPLHLAHQQLTFSVRSCPAAEVLAAVETQQADAGITYIGHGGHIAEGLGRVRHIPLFEERYRLLISSASRLASRTHVDWAEIAALPLSLLTPDMQNRRIIDERIQHAGVTPAPVLESNSIIVLVTHVRTGHWATVLPAIMAESLGASDAMRSIPVREEEPCPVIGLIYPQRDPLLPLTSALLAEVRTVFGTNAAKR
jgi:DNA-binding transcriptional LysR family regulator